jgi:hypothetical protein
MYTSKSTIAWQAPFRALDMILSDQKCLHDFCTNALSSNHDYQQYYCMVDMFFCQTTFMKTYYSHHDKNLFHTMTGTSKLSSETEQTVVHEIHSK